MSRILNKIVDWEQAAELSGDRQRVGLRIVFTNGVFDLIHPGHVLYLQEARSLGDFLVLGLNSDQSARTLNKGDHRPINDQKARATVVAALSSVDLVVLFDEPTPETLIMRLKPNILVKGGDYNEEEVAGGAYVKSMGGQVHIIPFVEGYSTSAIEQKILSSVNKK